MHAKGKKDWRSGIVRRAPAITADFRTLGKYLTEASKS
jgi:hypothetical protein